MNEENLSYVVMCFISNLYFSSRTESTVRGLGFKPLMVESADQISTLEHEPRPFELTEPLEGAGGELIEKITQWKPALLIFDLDNKLVPWREWISILKSSSASRRIPIICFGSHKDKTAIETAFRAGANGVFSRGQYVKELQVLIKEYAYTIDSQQLDLACRQPLSKLAIKGLEEFNNRNFFEAHEFLEDAWNEDESQGRELYRAILQIAVAYLQIERGNYRGARKMFLRVRQWIDPLPSSCRGVNVDELRHNAYRVQKEITNLEHKNLDLFENEFLRPIQFSILTED